MQKQFSLSAILLSQILLLSLFLISSMAADSSSSEAKVHIVYTERPEGQEPEQYHISTLASVLGRLVFPHFFCSFIRRVSFNYKFFCEKYSILCDPCKRKADIIDICEIKELFLRGCLDYWLGCSK